MITIPASILFFCISNPKLVGEMKNKASKVIEEYASDTKNKVNELVASLFP